MNANNLLLKNIFDKKLSTDTALTLISLGAMSLLGVLVNVIIGIYYSPESLGAFNQVYAIYILFSQFAVAGVHNSTLKYVAQFDGDEIFIGVIVSSSLILVSILAAPVTLFFFITRNEVAGLFSSPDLAVGIAWASIGLFFFALNKNLLAVLNARREIAAFAFLQATRVALMAIALVVSCELSVPGNRLTVIFSVSESILFVILFYRLRPLLIPSVGIPILSFIPVHLRFGSKSLMGGLVSELNTRVDVLILGYFSTDRIVGLYSMAAIAVELIQQAAIAIRTNINPILVKLYTAGDMNGLTVFIRKIVSVTYLGIAVASCVAIGLYYGAVNFLTIFSQYQSSFVYFLILISGLVAAGGYIPVNQLMMQSGLPGWQTILFTAVVLFNIAANILLVPFYQASGAAVATSTSIVFAAVAVKFFSRKKLGVKI